MAGDLAITLANVFSDKATSEIISSQTTIHHAGKSIVKPKTAVAHRSPHKKKITETAGGTQSDAERYRMIGNKQRGRPKKL